MIIKIAEILSDDADKGILISFFYTFRRAIRAAEPWQTGGSQILVGKWVGGNPEVNKRYDVEIAISDPLVWNETIFLSTTAEEYIKELPGGLELAGFLELFGDGFGTIRIGGSLITCEVCGEPVANADHVKVVCSEITLYDTNTFG